MLKILLLWFFHKERVFSNNKKVRKNGGREVGDWEKTRDAGNKTESCIKIWDCNWYLQFESERILTELCELRENWFI